MAEIIVALDLPGTDRALALVERLGDRVNWYKIGSQLFTAEGPDIVRRLQDRNKRVFLDLKFHDIPHTVARAVDAAAELKVDMLTLHASGGRTMLEMARDAVERGDGPALVGVTLLTSLTAAEVEELWEKELRSLRDEVARLAALAADVGLDGVVAAASEAETLKRRYGMDFLVITPGIRPPGEVIGDQTRTATPDEAVRAGADYLVIGRPITTAADPVGAVERIRGEMLAGEEAAS